jgi:hypothetical protein
MSETSIFYLFKKYIRGLISSYHHSVHMEGISANYPFQLNLCTIAKKKEAQFNCFLVKKLSFAWAVLRRLANKRQGP